MPRTPLVLCAGAMTVALAVPAAASAASTGKVSLQDVVPSGKATQVSVVVRRSASFSIVLRTRTQGRTQLYLLGKNAPRGGPLIDTATYACEGAAGSFVCRGAYEPLPAGTYTFRVVRRSGPGANVELSVRW